MNSVNIIGRLTREVERVPIVKANTEVAKFTIAVDSGMKDNPAYFFDCECWDDLAKTLWESVRKGDKVGISGKLVQYKFERRDGSKGSAVKIVCQRIDFLSPKHQNPAEEILDEEPKDEQKEELEILDDDLPF